VNPRILLALLVAGLLALVAVVVAMIDASNDPPDVAQAGDELTGSRLPPDVRAPDFSLSDQDGKPVSMRELRGRPVIVTFLYTHCEETCPGQAQQIKGALNDLGEDVPALAISVEPPRDTPASARRFLAKQGMSGRIRFVLGSQEELRPLWRAYAVQPQLSGAEHQARLLIVDKRGFQRVSFPLDRTTPDDITHDLRILRAE
jgi:protein SCO1/2